MLVLCRTRLRLPDEVLLDVDNVVLSHAAKMRWNPADQWLFSEQIAHPPIIDRMTSRKSR